LRNRICPFLFKKSLITFWSEFLDTDFRNSTQLKKIRADQRQSVSKKFWPRDAQLLKLAFASK
jgi:hypothetical protein